jgi:hypothetical protein
LGNVQDVRPLLESSRCVNGRRLALCDAVAAAEQGADLAQLCRDCAEFARLAREVLRVRPSTALNEVPRASSRSSIPGGDTPPAHWDSVVLHYARPEGAAKLEAMIKRAGPRERKPETKRPTTAAASTRTWDDVLGDYTLNDMLMVTGGR